jgi:hypothetical protein
MPQIVGSTIDRKYGIACAAMMVEHSTEICRSQETVALRQPATSAGAAGQGLRRSVLSGPWRGAR